MPTADLARHQVSLETTLLCLIILISTSRKLSSPEHLLSLDVSSGILVPLFDPDTNMVFLSGKGDRWLTSLGLPMWASC